MKMCIRWKPCALFVGVQDGEATVEKGFQVGQWEGICLQMQETQARSLVWDNPLEKETATILAGKI